MGVRLHSPQPFHEVAMRRTGLAVVLALGLVIAPLAAEAQPSAKAYRIGILTGVFAPNIMVPLRQALSELGDVEGQ